MMPLNLSFGLNFTDLFETDGLEKLDSRFLQSLNESAPELCQRLLNARQNKGSEDTNLLLELAPFVEDFMGELFQIRKEMLDLQSRHHHLANLSHVKRQFVQRVAVRKYPADSVVGLDMAALRANLENHLHEPLTELSLANKIRVWMDDETQFSGELDLAAKYCAWASLTEAGREIHPQDYLFHLPKKTDPLNLLEIEQDNLRIMGLQKNQRLRDGFALTDSGFTRAQALDQANYCIWCHHQGKDSCSKGLKPKGESADRFQKNSFGQNLLGCPLEEKISEMNEAKSKGYTLGALAIITIDNPMVAGTGHRICNDCMKACIYQKQEPVNIPGVESQILRDVLDLPWGFEIYSLLTRWNPLNFERPLPRPESGYKVLVVGLGPAGFTLSHHLMNDGHRVVAVDGLKIEPMDPAISGVDGLGNRQEFQPIRDISTLLEDLDKRVNAGFGGVAEYGITVRWDKNNLKLIRLLLERRQQFTMVGGVRFGGTLTVEQAFAMGFDHIALCMGAGSPTLIPMKNSLAPGVRQASDFLMALQLTGAAKRDSLANLQIRLPAVVIGGGLTAIDTATETLAYYPVQVEKFTRRFDELVSQKGEAAVRGDWSDAELPLVDEFLAHGRAVLAERALAEKENRLPNFQALVTSWGGVTLVYRRDFTQSPSYTLNYEEVAKALEEGISIVDQATPLEVVVDELGHAMALKVQVRGEDKSLPARAILVAAGTKPNTNLLYDDPKALTLDGKTFQAYDEAGNPVQPERLAKPEIPQMLISKLSNGKGISFFGDMHPSFAGNVVKAMASAKQGYPSVTRFLNQSAPSKVSPQDLAAQVNQSLRAQVVAVNRLTPTIVEVVLHAPLAAQNFHPGQFYRLQNFETLAPLKNHTRMGMEGLALTGASVDRDTGTLSTIILEMGGSSDLCQDLKPGEPVILMGPTGTATHIPEKETVLLAGGGLGNAVLFSIGQAMRAKGCRVIYFAAYKKVADRYKVEEIEAAADQVIWCCDEAPGFSPSRPQDRSFQGNIVEAMLAHAKGDLGDSEIQLSQVQRLIAIGSDRMMAAVASARHGVLQPYLNASAVAIGSINSPMQCMMKEICAQCLQRHVDPVTGEERIVYSCANQDQPLDWVDFGALNQRLSQNTVQEKLTRQWITHVRG